MSKRFLSTFGLLFTVLFAFVLPHGSFAQFKYTPDHEEVQEMAENAAGFLANFNGFNAGERILCALTIMEVNKRYRGEIPKDHPLVQSALAEILKIVDKVDREHAMYEGALATIFLCELNDREYAPEIKILINWIESRQNVNGGWGYENLPLNCDTSQSQYACLALFIAKHHNFNINNQTAKRALDFLTGFQNQNGTWYYHYTAGGTMGSRSDESPSLHCSGLGSVYLLADLLQLTPRSKNMTGGKKGSTGLPPSVSIYVKPKEGDPEQVKKEGPLVNFDRGKLTSTKARGNRWIADNFTVNSNSWNNYYLYALERYAFFREQAEGSFAEVPDWYDQGVDLLKTQQNTATGGFQRGSEGPLNEWVATSLATLFLVRSSEILIQPISSSLLDGGIGFPEKGVMKLQGGKLQSQAAIKGIADLMEMLGDDATGEDAQALVEAAKITAASIGQGKSRAERLALLTGMVKERNYIKRLIAVKVLAGEQNMDNVPALLYALGDPTIDVAKQAHDGLRLISRRIDAFPIPAKPTHTDFQVVKKRWTEWFLSIRPDAELID